MAKGQKRGNREIKKPKAEKPRKEPATAGLLKPVEPAIGAASRPRAKR